MTRDFRGYGDRPPDPRWPGGARVAVSFVVNVEEGAELALSAGDERNEAVYEVMDEVRGVPDPCMETHFEYGTRAGYWRIMGVLDRFRVPATLSACGRAVKAIAAAAGARPLGWHTRSAASPNTRRLLVESGFLYDSDAYSDDLPFFVLVGAKSHLVIPYSFDTNDMHFHQGSQRFVTGGDFAGYVIDAFDTLWREGASAPKMLSVGLHLRMNGRPGRMQDKGNVWFTRRDAIAHHWIALFGSVA